MKKEQIEQDIITMRSSELEGLIDEHNYELEEIKFKNNRVRLSVGFVPPHRQKVLWNQQGEAFEYNEQERCENPLPDYNLL